MKFYLVYKDNGLYDLTLDDYDPIYDQIDQDDFDQPSHPTEVFQIQQFPDTPLDSKDPSRSRTGSRGNLDRSFSEGRDLTFNEQRSLTESPYFLNTKPYRPFSTEPSPIPPLEKPIILNPNYHDEFGFANDNLDLPNELPEVDEFAGILSEQSRYKLPISKQYDPNGTKLKKTKEITTVTKTVEETIVTEEIVTKEVKVTSVEERLVEQKENKFRENVKNDIDLDKIEMTATSIVDESIEKAISVADEIKKEIDIELSAISSETKTSATESETRVVKSEKIESFKEINELNELTSKTNESTIKKSDVSVAKEVAKFEKEDKQTIIDERQEFRKQELEETIESGSVRRKSEMYDKDSKAADIKIEKKHIDESIESGSVKRKSEIYDKDMITADTKVEKISKDEIIESGSVRRKSEMYNSDVKKADVKVVNKFTDDTIESGSVRRKSEMYDTNIEQKQTKIISDQRDIKVAQSAQQRQTTNIKSEKSSTVTENTLKSEESKTKEAKYSTAKLLAEQRAYTIGLQTIPHIRGTVQSNYHYDLLLKTFFIHLTDVMVALSRFILAEPVLSKPLESKPEDKKEVSEVTRTVTSDTTVVKDSITEYSITDRSKYEEKKEKVERVADVIKHDQARESRQQEYTEYVEKIQLDSEKREKAVLSGAEMAQLSEKRSGELITKMDGVITEFQTKAGLEEEITMQRERRSRSRSKLEDEIVKEAVPHISKVDRKSEEITEVKTTSSVLESTEIKTETKLESIDVKRESKHDTKQVSSIDGKNTYISICEAHVYTNKNSILDEVSELSEVTSVESIKETNIALEANEAMTTEGVAIESQSQIKQQAEAIVESHEITNAIKEEIIVQEKKDLIEDVQTKTIEIETKKEEVEAIEIKQPIVELHEDIVEKAVSVEVKNKLDIQEIESSEYVNELNEVSKGIVETQDIQETKEVHDVQIVEDIAIKGEEHVSMKTVDIVEVKEEIIQDVKERVSIEKEDVEVFKEEKVFIKEEAAAVQSAKDEVVLVKTEAVEVTEDVKIEDTKVTEQNIEVKDEYAHLKVTKEEITEFEENVEINQEIEVNIKKSVHIAESENQYQSFISDSFIENAKYEQEASFIVKSTDSSFTVQESQETITRSTEDAKKQLTLDLTSTIKKSDSQSSVKSTISTPTPSTVPPTPLTDEYVFRLQMPLPKLTGPPVPRSPSPEDEDPHIVKKNLVPHIDTEIIEEVVYETPLPTPPEDKTSPPKFTKPGLKGGNMKYIFYKEEIKEIERKSSLLASAIDQTIKSIEEYKEEVGLDTKVESPVVYNGYAKVIDTKIYKDKLDEVNIEKQIVKNTENINKIVENRANPSDSVNRVHLDGKPAHVTVTVENNVINSRSESSENKMDDSIETVCVEGYRPVPFNPEDAPHLERVEIRIPEPIPTVDPGKAFVAENGEIMGTHQGIVDGLEEAVVDEEIAKELGKPGMTEEKIAAIISGESEMLREAHVMGLTRVLKSHMHRDNDDSSVDFKKIKPIMESLKDSEVLKALNEEFVKTQEEKKKEERKWTKFLQKPARPVPKAKFGYHGWTANDDEEKESPYKVKIVKQPKPKVAPDYKPQDFNTGPLPWEERAQNEPPPPPVEAEPPILIPEEKPVFLEALDNLPETAVPDLEETGIELPPETPIEEISEETPEAVTEETKETKVEEAEEIKKEVPIVEENSNSESEMENRIAEQLIKNVEGMVDPKAPLEQQLAQMRAQLAALAQLPGVIQQTLELVSRQLCQITQQEAQSHHIVTQEQKAIESSEMIEESNDTSETIIEDVTEEKDDTQIEEVVENGMIKEEVKQTKTIEEVKQTKTEEIKKVQISTSSEEMEKMKREEQEILDEQRRIEKQKKELSMLDQEYEAMLQETPHEIARRFINELMGSLLLEKEPKHMKQRASLSAVSLTDQPKPDCKEKVLASPQRDQESRQKPRTSLSASNPQEKKELMADLQQDQESRQLKQRPTPRVGKPKPVFGPLTPSERPVVLPGGRKWRNPKDAYNDAFIAETLTAQAELIQGKALGVNFMKYEKPPITTDHLKNSEVYKMIHGMEQEPVKRVELLTPVIAEADYRELPSKLEYLRDSEVYKMVHDEQKEPLRGVKMLQYIMADSREYQEKCRSVTPTTAEMRR